MLVGPVIADIMAGTDTESGHRRRQPPADRHEIERRGGPWQIDPEPIVRESRVGNNRAEHTASREPRVGEIDGALRHAGAPG